MSILSVSFHIYTVSAIRRSEALEGRGNEAPLAVSSCPSLPKPWELIGMGKFGCSHHHHHQHYHTLSSHSPTLFGVSCRNIFLKVFLTKLTTKCHFFPWCFSEISPLNLALAGQIRILSCYIYIHYMLYVICNIYIYIILYIVCILYILYIYILYILYILYIVYIV